MSDEEAAADSADIVTCIDETPSVVTFSDGTSFVLNHAALPLELLVGEENKIYESRFGACKNCEVYARKQVRENAGKKISLECQKVEDGEPSLFEDMFGEVAQRIGYRFDPRRIRTRVSKRPVPVYDARL